MVFRHGWQMKQDKKFIDCVAYGTRDDNTTAEGLTRIPNTLTLFRIQVLNKEISQPNPRNSRNAYNENQLHVSFHVSRRKRLDSTGPIRKPRPKDPICILEHAILQTDDDELGALESSLDQSTDVLCVRQIQSGVNLIENVHGSWLEL